MKLKAALKSAFKRKKVPKAQLLWALAGFALALILAYITRVACLYILARLFEKLNLNAETYSNAPALLKYIADNSSELSNIFALIMGCACLKLIDKSEAYGKRRFKPIYLLSAPISALVGFGLVLMLRALDEVKLFNDALTDSACVYIERFMICAFTALWIRETLVKKLDCSMGIALSCIISAILEALSAIYIFGEANAILILNALLWGLCAVLIYRLTGGVLTEILISFGFYLGQRLIGKYPDGGAFYYSANNLSGGAFGLYGSLLTSAALIILLALILKFKETEDEKAVVRA